MDKILFVFIVTIAVDHHDVTAWSHIECPSPGIEFTVNSIETCYWIVQTTQDIIASEELCLKEGGNLGILVNESIADRIYTFMSYAGVWSNWVYLGYEEYDEIVTVRNTGNQQMWINWDNNEPNEKYPPENCVAMKVANGRWHDVPCTFSACALCSKSTPTDMPNPTTSTIAQFESVTNDNATQKSEITEETTATVTQEPTTTFTTTQEQTTNTTIQEPTTVTTTHGSTFNTTTQDLTNDTTQEQTTNTTIQEPTTVTTTQESTFNTTTQDLTNDTTQEPTTNTTTKEQTTNTTTQEPTTNTTTQDQTTYTTTKEPTTVTTIHGPTLNTTLQDLTTNTTQNPTTNTTTQEQTTHEPTNNTTIQEPTTIATTQEPTTIATTQEPTTITTTKQTTSTTTTQQTTSTATPFLALISSTLITQEPTSALYASVNVTSLFYVHCVCHCVESNYTIGELEDKLENLKEQTKVDTETLSSTIRTKTCADDPRPSAAHVGYLGLGILILISIAILLPDILNIVITLLRLSLQDRNCS